MSSCWRATSDWRVRSWVVRFGEGVSVVGIVGGWVMLVGGSGLSFWGLGVGEDLRRRGRPRGRCS